MALQRTGHTLMIWSRLSKWLLPSVNIIQPGCWSCHQHSKAASAISATYSKHNNLVHQRRPLSRVTRSWLQDKQGPQLQEGSSLLKCGVALDRGARDQRAHDATPQASAESPARAAGAADAHRG